MRIMRISRRWSILYALILVLSVACEPNNGSEQKEEQIDADVVLLNTTLENSRYYGATGITGSYNYHVVLCSEEGGYYHFDLYADDGTIAGEHATIPEGEYTLDKLSAMSIGTIAAGFSGYTASEGRYAELVAFDEARLVVGQSMVEAFVTLNGDTTHYVKYEGEPIVTLHRPSSTPGMSTLGTNHYFNIEYGVFVGAYVGDLMNSGCNTCQVYLWEYLDLETGEERGDTFQVDLQLPRGGRDVCGSYSVGTREGEFIPGSALDVGGQYMQQNSWYITADYATFAPLVDGRVTVVSEDGYDYSFIMDLVDDCGHVVRGIFRGHGEFTDW